MNWSRTGDAPVLTRPQKHEVSSLRPRLNLFERPERGHFGLTTLSVRRLNPGARPSAMKPTARCRAMSRMAASVLRTSENLAPKQMTVSHCELELPPSPPRRGGGGGSRGSGRRSQQTRPPARGPEVRDRLPLCRPFESIHFFTSSRRRTKWERAARRRAAAAEKGTKGEGGKKKKKPNFLRVFS